MTTAIETTKRHMYCEMKLMFQRLFSYGIGNAGYANDFESAFEAHLEELRKELKTAKEDAEGANILKNEFQQRLMAMTEERDAIQGRLHAIDHAYHVQAQANIAAGKELREVQQELKRQIELRAQAEKVSAIRLNALHDAATLRKAQGSTSAQYFTGNFSSGTYDAFQAPNRALCSHHFEIIPHNGKIVCSICRITAGEQA
jgi:hypothetical protein